jgi:hypothetical protein
MADEKLLTRYLIFETDEDAVVFTRVGEQLAGGSEEAIRKFQADPPVDREGFLVAVSENSFKLRKAKATVRTSLTDVEIGALPERTRTGDASSNDPVEEPEPTLV